MRALLPRLAAAPLLALAGCAGAVAVDPAPGAADPACARVLAAAPEVLAGLEPRATTAQAALAWGDPAVVLRCGVDPLGPTTEDCTTVEGPDGTAVDWVAVPGEDAATFTTYGRVPALELVVPAALTDPEPALPQVLLGDLGPAAAAARQDAACLGPEG